MAEIVGEGVPEKVKEQVLSHFRILRCQAGGSLRNGNFNCKSPLDDVAILQAHVRAVQNLVRGQGLPFRSG